MKARHEFQEELMTGIFCEEIIFASTAIAHLTDQKYSNAFFRISTASIPSALVAARDSQLLMLN
jgi:hypothetical protein